MSDAEPQATPPVENPDFDRDEMVQNTDPDEPDRSRTYRFFRFLSENLLIVAGSVFLVLFILASFLGVELPRNLRIIGLSGSVVLVLVGRPVGSKVKDLLWDPNYIWIVDIDARESTGAIFRVPSQRFREYRVRDGQLDWVSRDLCFAQDVDLEEQTLTGTWRGTLTDRELMRSLRAVEECREMLEEDAKRGFAWETQAFVIVRRATRNAVHHIIETFEEATLPDKGEGITEEVNRSLDEFGLERKLAQVREDDNPASDVPGVDLDGAPEQSPLTPDLDGDEGGATADD